MRILLPLAWVFRLLVELRNLLFDFGIFKVKRLPGKTISVGNIAVGGTGKSPIVIEFARMLKSQGAKPAIVTRGYRSGLRPNQWQVILNGRVIAGCSDHGITADEALMQSNALPGVPVIVGQKRGLACDNYRDAVKDHEITHWILDDGFQHRQIARDLDVVLIDARAPDGPLLPAGLFREPLSALRRAGMVVITKFESLEQSAKADARVKRVTDCPIFHTSFVPAEPRLMCGGVSQLPSKWCLVAGIANPEDFASSARSTGVVPVKTLFYGDHRAIGAVDLLAAVKDCDAVLTTEKDWARSEKVYRATGLATFVLPLSVRWVEPTEVLTSKISI